MIKYFEECLYNKTKGTQSEILYAQWNYDKANFPKALQAVSNLFPHYSLHDESHSITILNNIIRIIGKENIDKLSAIDIWLILEAAYCHDIGMVVTSNELIDAIKQKDFIDFFKDLLDDKKNSLHEFASLFQIEGGVIKYKTDSFDFKIYDGIKFVLAEYFRRIHAERSKEIIIDPVRELSIISPRGTIPPRIIKMLANICAHHTKDFSDVINLPFCEVGIDVEDAHPRYVACLLRIGDLLDLDNNRFSEVMLRTLSKIPIDTINHKAKHLSIESFRVDKEMIEIIAHCKDYDTANITQHWFNYLNSEITNQMIYWNNIVPNKLFGYLPTIGDLRVILAGYEYIDGKNKPKFSVDTDKALSLLQGAGLYEGAHQCIREILQNSVDSSLIRMWLEYKDLKDFSAPQSQDFITLTKEFPIEINIQEMGVENETKKWSLEIKDNGTGISTHDLKFLMNTGSSSKNRERINIIETMPRWLRPSGTFGIGFQSIFMITDSVTIETKSFFTEEFQIIELNSPNSKKDGDILIQKKKTTHSFKPGAKMRLDYKTEIVPNSYSIKSRYRTASKMADEYDPFSHKSMDIGLGMIMDEVFDFSSKSYFPTVLKINGDNIKIHQGDKKNFEYYDDENFLEMNILINNENRREKTQTYYKNQQVENKLGINFLNFEFNIHKDIASKVLTLDRNKIKNEYYEDLSCQIFQSCYKIIIDHFEDIFKDDDEKILGSMFLKYYSYKEEVKNVDINKFKQWENFLIKSGEGKIRFIEVLNRAKEFKILYNTDPITPFVEIIEFEDEILYLKIKGYRPSAHTTDFVLNKVQELFIHVLEIKQTDDKIKEITFTKTENNFFSTLDIETVIINCRKNNSGSARTFIPCVNEFTNLRIKDEAFVPYVFNYNLNRTISIPYPKMLSPFVLEQTSKYHRYHLILKKIFSDSLFTWVFENRYDKKTTLEEIKKGYEDFCNRIDLDKINSIEL